MKLVHKGTTNEVQTGDKIKDFRGGTATVTGKIPPHNSNSTGRVVVETGSFFPSVFNLEWIEREDHE